MNKFHYTVLLMCVLIGGCMPSERPLRIGVDQCEHCLMTVSDERYGAEIVLPTGKVLAFDSVECLASYLLDNSIEFHSLWVVDYAHPGSMMPAQNAAFVHSDALRSPMGMNLAAFNPEAAADRPVEGIWMNWDEVLELVRAEGSHMHPAVDSSNGSNHH